MKTCQTTQAYSIRSLARRGFTLVELLIVIAIIAILAGLAIPAVMMALRTSSEFQISTRISQLDTAIEAFRNEKKVYPPDHFFDINGITASTVDGWLSPTDPNLDTKLIALYGPFLQKFAPNHREFSPAPGRYPGDDLPIVAWYKQRGQFLNPTNAMSFWLGGGLSDSSLYPLSESIRLDSELPATNVAANSAYVARLLTYEPLVFYDFGNEREIDPLEYWTAAQYSDPLSGSGSLMETYYGDTVPVILRSPVQRNTDRPYLYFVSNYKTGTDLSDVKYAKVDGEAGGIMQCFGYGTPQVFFAPERFQIIAAGIDEEYGLNDLARMRDDIVNFGGPRRADAIPEMQAQGL